MYERFNEHLTKQFELKEKVIQYKKLHEEYKALAQKKHKLRQEIREFIMEYRHCFKIEKTGFYGDGIFHLRYEDINLLVIVYLTINGFVTLVIRPIRNVKVK